MPLEKENQFFVLKDDHVRFGFSFQKEGLVKKYAPFAIKFEKNMYVGVIHGDSVERASKYIKDYFVDNHHTNADFNYEEWIRSVHIGLGQRGWTAVTALIVDETLIVANSGDSGAVVCSKCKKDWSSFNNTAYDKTKPDITHLRTGCLDLLIIASNGIWNASQQVISCIFDEIYESMEEKPETHLPFVLYKLYLECIDKCDNMTIILIPFLHQKPLIEWWLSMGKQYNDMPNEFKYNAALDLDLTSTSEDLDDLNK